MAVNVTEKDKTLNEIIYFCEEVMSVWCRLEGARPRIQGSAHRRNRPLP